MSEFITALSSLFTFLIGQLTSISSFFTDSTLGQIILGIAIFSLVASIIMSFVNKLR